MKLIKDTTWPEVFEDWRERESSNPGWIQCATEVKGWPDWESWRKFSASLIHADQRDWQIYEFTDPSNQIPSMLMGPYSAWQSDPDKKNTLSFEDLLNIPEQFQKFSTHSAIKSILNGLPFTTNFIGLLREDINKIVCIEGHHRATAISLAKKQGLDINYDDVGITIALAKIKKEDLHLLDEMLERGSSK